MNNSGASHPAWATNARGNSLKSLLALASGAASLGALATAAQAGIVYVPFATPVTVGFGTDQLATSTIALPGGTEITLNRQTGTSKTTSTTVSGRTTFRTATISHRIVAAIDKDGKFGRQNGARSATASGTNVAFRTVYGKKWSSATDRSGSSTFGNIIRSASSLLTGPGAFSQKYLLFKFTNTSAGDQTQYGWLGMSGATINPGNSDVMSVTFTGWAYDNSGAMINAGALPPPCSATTASHEVVGGNMQMTFINYSQLTSVQALVMNNCAVSGIAYNGANSSLGSVGPLSLTDRTFLPTGTVKVVLTATKVNPGSGATVNVLALEPCGQGKSFDPVITTLAVKSGTQVQQRFEGLFSAEHYLRVVNGAPGLKWLEVNLNGRTFRLDPLASNQDLEADLASAMLEGDRNVVTLTGGGAAGASALVFITDTAMGQLVALPEIVTLAASHTAEGLALSWPGTLIGWQLQSAPGPDAPWSDVTVAPVAAGDRLTVLAPATDGARFYRLRAPATTAPRVNASASKRADAALAVPAMTHTQLPQHTYDGILW